MIKLKTYLRDLPLLERAPSAFCSSISFNFFVPVGDTPSTSLDSINLCKFISNYSFEIKLLKSKPDPLRVFYSVKYLSFISPFSHSSLSSICRILSSVPSSISFNTMWVRLIISDLNLTSTIS